MIFESGKLWLLILVVLDPLGHMNYEPCPFGSGLRKFALDPVVVIFFRNAKKNTSGGLILSLEKFGLILYFNFLQKIFM